MTEQLVLTSERAEPEPQKKRARPVDHRERVALRKLGNPAGFEFYRWEVITDDAILLVGCVPNGVYVKGKRKGRPRYDGPVIKVVVTRTEESEERARYEIETGNCGECMGDGDTWAGWSRETGHAYRQCALCHGSKRA